MTRELPCQGNHRYFVAETVGVEKDGTVFVLVVCTACGETKSNKFQVAAAGTPLLLKNENKQTKETN